MGLYYTFASMQMFYLHSPLVTNENIFISIYKLCIVSDTSSSQLGEISPSTFPRDMWPCLKILWNVVTCTRGGEDTFGISLVETGDVGKRAAMPTDVPDRKELASPNMSVVLSLRNPPTDL